MRCVLFLSALVISAAALPRSPRSEVIPAVEPTVSASTSVIVEATSSTNVGVPVPSQANLLTKAVVVLAGPSPVTGVVTFTQTSESGPVTVSGLIQGLDPNSQRGFHVHAYGDLSGGCDSAGPHFNPDNRTHGDRLSANRHTGDLGNIESDENGVADFSFDDYYIQLNGPLNIVGRAVVVHAGRDDLGLGGQSDSLTTGHAGARHACGVIGFAPNA